MPKIIGLITANYSTKFPSALSDSRPAASMPFLGRYRAVDFALSNMVNCGIRTVGMVMPYNYRSLIDHVGSGREWELTRKSGGLFILPGSAFGTSRTGSRFLLRDLIHNKIFLERDKAEHVIVSSASWVYNMDYKELVDAHVASGADITAVTQAAHDKDVDVCGLDVVDGRVKGIKHGIVFGDTAFLDCFVVGRERLLEILDWYAANDYLDLFEALAGEYDRVNVQAYEFEGYAAPIFNKDAYFKANMDMLDPKITRELFSIRPIKTKAHDNQPAKFEAGCKVTNSASLAAAASGARSSIPSSDAASPSRRVPSSRTPSSCRAASSRVAPMSSTRSWTATTSCLRAPSSVAPSPRFSSRARPE